jgi:hypothetical protein
MNWILVQIIKYEREGNDVCISVEILFGLQWKIGFWISCVVCVLHHFVLVLLDLSSLLFFVFRLDLMQLDCLCSRIDFSSQPGLNFLDREWRSHFIRLLRFLELSFSFASLAPTSLFPTPDFQSLLDFIFSSWSVPGAWFVSSTAKHKIYFAARFDSSPLLHALKEFHFPA